MGCFSEKTSAKMTDSPQFLVLAAVKSVRVITKDEVAEHIYTDGEFRVVRSVENISALAGHTRLYFNPVEFIHQEESLPPHFMRLSLPQGPRKRFAAVANLRYNAGGPLSTGLHPTWVSSGLSSFSYVIGGAPVQKSFPLSQLLQLEE